MEPCLACSRGAADRSTENLCLNNDLRRLNAFASIGCSCLTPAQGNVESHIEATPDNHSGANEPFRGLHLILMRFGNLAGVAESTPSSVGKFTNRIKQTAL